MNFATAFRSASYVKEYSGKTPAGDDDVIPSVSEGSGGRVAGGRAAPAHPGPSLTLPISARSFLSNRQHAPRLAVVNELRDGVLLGVVRFPDRVPDVIAYPSPCEVRRIAVHVCDVAQFFLRERDDVEGAGAHEESFVGLRLRRQDDVISVVLDPAGSAQRLRRLARDRILQLRFFSQQRHGRVGELIVAELRRAGEDFLRLRDCEGGRRRGRSNGFRSFRFAARDDNERENGEASHLSRERTSSAVSSRTAPLARSPMTMSPIATRTSFSTRASSASTIRRTWRLRPSVMVMSNFDLPTRSTIAGRVMPSRNSMPRRN